MKREIHRMQLRYSQLMRRQEELMAEMERAIFKRDSIAIRGKAKQQQPHGRGGGGRAGGAAGGGGFAGAHVPHRPRQGRAEPPRDPAEVQDGLQQAAERGEALQRVAARLAGVDDRLAAALDGQIAPLEFE
ncbi:hypothetical protein T484DRAFT_2216443 [Baffinella frigidus]|nr:hypothetical protein T484DRAFT_2216443 [Cryptophyta sp. CCMP2293]